MPDKFVEYVAADAPVPGANGDYNVERNGTAKALPAIVANVDLISWSAPTMPGLYRVFAGVVVDNGATSGQWLVRGHARKVGNGALVKVGSRSTTRAQTSASSTRRRSRSSAALR